MFWTIMYLWVSNWQIVVTVFVTLCLILGLKNETTKVHQSQIKGPKTRYNRALAASFCHTLPNVKIKLNTYVQTAHVEILLGCTKQKLTF